MHVKLLCFSDIHGSVDAVRALVADTAARGAAYDAVIVAGDMTNLVVTKELEAEQRNYDEILGLLQDSYGRVYYVPGNRDRTGRGKKAKSIMFTYPTLLEPGKKYDLAGDIKVTASPELAAPDTILVQHSNIAYAGRFDRTAMISRDALLHITGHTHTGVWTRNYLNTGFLYRDGSNGATPMMGGYFEVGIDGADFVPGEINVQFHALGPIKGARLKCTGFEGRIFAPHGRAFPVKLGLYG